MASYNYTLESRGIEKNRNVDEMSRVSITFQTPSSDGQIEQSMLDLIDALGAFNFRATVKVTETLRYAPIDYRKSIEVIE